MVASSAWNKVTAQFEASIGFQRLRGTAALQVNESLQGFDRSRLVKSKGTLGPPASNDKADPPQILTITN